MSPIARELFLHKQNIAWVRRKPLFEEIVSEIRRIWEKYPKSTPNAEFARLEELAGQFPDSDATLASAYAIVRGDATIEEIYPPELVASIEEQESEFQEGECQ